MTTDIDELDKTASQRIGNLFLQIMSVLLELPVIPNVASPELREAFV